MPWKELDTQSLGETSDPVRVRCDAARARQNARGCRNAWLTDSDLDRTVAASAKARALLGRAVDRFGLSARSARKAMKVARTIADLAGEAETGPAAIAEAIGYRPETGPGH